MANTSPFWPGFRPTTMGPNQNNSHQQNNHHNHHHYHDRHQGPAAAGQQLSQQTVAAATAPAVHSANSFLPAPPTVMSGGPSAGPYLFPQPLAMMGSFGQHLPYFASTFPAYICLPLYLPLQVLGQNSGPVTAATTTTTVHNNNSPLANNCVPSYRSGCQPQQPQLPQHPQHHQQQSPAPPAGQYNSASGCPNQFRTNQMTRGPGGEGRRGSGGGGGGVQTGYQRDQPNYPPAANVPLTTATTIKWTTPIADTNTNNNNNNNNGHNINIPSFSSCPPPPPRPFQPQQSPQTRCRSPVFAHSTPKQQRESTPLDVIGHRPPPPPTPPRPPVPDSTTPPPPPPPPHLPITDPKKRKSSPAENKTGSGGGNNDEPCHRWKMPEYIPTPSSSRRLLITERELERERQKVVEAAAAGPVVETEEYRMYRIRFLNCLDTTCDQAFGTRTGLLGHMLEVHGIQEHQCPLMGENCTASFERKEHLWAHLKAAHRGRLSWDCYACFRIFDDPLSFEWHFDLEHREGYYECTFADCPFYSYQLRPVLDHYKAVHGGRLFTIDRSYTASYRQPW